MITGKEPISPIYSCSECLNDCDCPSNQYCSQNYGSVGTCLSFQAEGKECIPMSTKDLLDATIDSTYKCADVVLDEMNQPIITGPRDEAGNLLATCINSVCRSCNPYLSVNIGEKNVICGSVPGRKGWVNSILSIKYLNLLLTLILY